MARSSRGSDETDPKTIKPVRVESNHPRHHAHETNHSPVAKHSSEYVRPEPKVHYTHYEDFSIPSQGKGRYGFEFSVVDGKELKISIPGYKDRPFTIPVSEVGAEGMKTLREAVATKDYTKATDALSNLIISDKFKNNRQIFYATDGRVVHEALAQSLNNSGRGDKGKIISGMIEKQYNEVVAVSTGMNVELARELRSSIVTAQDTAQKNGTLDLTKYPEVQRSFQAAAAEFNNYDVFKSGSAKQNLVTKLDALKTAMKDAGIPTEDLEKTFGYKEANRSGAITANSISDYLKDHPETLKNSHYSLNPQQVASGKPQPEKGGPAPA